MIVLYLITLTKLLAMFDPHLVHCESSICALGHSLRNIYTLPDIMVYYSF